MKKEDLDSRLNKLEKSIREINDQIERRVIFKKKESNIGEVVDTKKRYSAELDRLLLIQQRPIVDDLRRAGFCVDRVEGLAAYEKSRVSTSALPILAAHLKLAYSDRIKYAMAMFFLEARDRFYWNCFVDEFISSGKEWSIYSDIVANVIVKIARKSDIEQLLSLIDCS